jgi:hypothetical protein
LNKYLPALVCGFAAGVLNIVPVVKNFSCCLIIPTAAIFSLVLYQRANKDFTMLRASTSTLFGLLTGIFAALFGTTFEIIIIFISKTSDINTAIPELEKLMKNLPASSIWDEIMNLMYKISDEITQKGFSLIYSISILFSNLIVNSIFGMIGGIVGMQILNNRMKPKT